MHPATPLKIGDSKVLNCWVHDNRESSTVMFNHSWWPGIAEGDMLSVAGPSGYGNSPEPKFFFIVPKDDGNMKPQLQACVTHQLFTSSPC
jgi:hypothetical protein